jgi:hypothetical protein
MLMFARPGVRLAALVALMISVLGTSAAASAPAQLPTPAALPSPLRFVSYLDLECFPTELYQPPDTVIVTRHLNPVLADLPEEKTRLGVREELCVPVAKNDLFPPRDVLPFIQFVDLSCYRIEGEEVNVPLRLDHLNPLLAELFPAREVAILFPVQLCVPVMKNGVEPPDEVRRLVSFIDLKCYLEKPPEPLGLDLTLTHLNPVLVDRLPPHKAVVLDNRELCVPVQKDDQQIPDDVLNIVRWIDLEKYDIKAEPLREPVTLTLDHLNPLLADLPTEKVTLTQARHLMVPVAKNGEFPPDS